MTLTPSAAENYHFVNWSGDVPSGHETDNPLSVTMNADKNITANFTINTYTLTVNATNGTVALNPPTGPYDYGTSVTLTPSAAEGYTFTGWSGDVPSGHETDNPLSVTMNADKNITANFTINTYTLTVSATNGTVAKNPPTGPYNYGTSVTLTPNAAEGYTFTGWSGNVPSGHETDNPLSVTMNADKNITANFAINTYTLTVVAVNGTVAKIPNQLSYNFGTVVTLTPSAATGYHFVNWSGDVPSGHGMDNPLSVTIDANKNITANFAINTYTLTAIAMSGGSIMKVPDQASYDSNATVSLTAMPATGYLFRYWRGDVPIGHETDNSLTITMDKNKTITAYFLSVKIPMSIGWNLISIPRVQTNFKVSVLFPDYLSSAFEYNTATRQYDAVAILANGPGYWINYSKVDTILITGPPPGILSVTAAQSGWVIVGSRDTTFNVSTLILSDGAIRLSSAYRYDATAREYVIVSMINPGEAIWINVNKACTITLP